MNILAKIFRRFRAAIPVILLAFASTSAPSTASAQVIINGRDASTGGARPFNLDANGIWLQNYETTVLASGAQTATFNGADQTNYSARGVILYVNVTAATGTSPTLTVQLQEKDPASGVYANIPGAVTASITAAGFSVFSVYPGESTSANAQISAVLPRVWRAVYTIGGTTPSFTMSVGATLIK